jgi:hypothetical protein
VKPHQDKLGNFWVHKKLYTPIQHPYPYTLHPHPYTPNNQSIDVGILEA